MISYPFWGIPIRPVMFVTETVPIELTMCASYMAIPVLGGLSQLGTMWSPPVISRFINPMNYSYEYHKP